MFSISKQSLLWNVHLWRPLVERLHQCTLLFTGIRLRPERAFVPRTVMIGGKVGRSVLQIRLSVTNAAAPPAGGPGVPHGQDDHQTDHLGGRGGQQRPGGGRPAESRLPGELQSVVGRARWVFTDTPTKGVHLIAVQDLRKLSGNCKPLIFWTSLSP